MTRSGTATFEGEREKETFQRQRERTQKGKRRDVGDYADSRLETSCFASLSVFERRVSTARKRQLESQYMVRGNEEEDPPCSSRLRIFSRLSLSSAVSSAFSFSS